ncbi:MAG TPA: glycogen synthase GlgA [Candidatus Acidoferrum sp.]|nr:glycogen synthase GlgA [Candidatus Acidoferrum sp.]
MRILVVSSELHPYSKSGGLADMVGALAKTLAAEGHQVGVVTPLYRGIREKFPGIEPFDWVLDLPLGSARAQGGVFVLKPAENLTIYFIDQPAFFDRASLYTERGADYADNAERFTFFSKAAVNLARYLPWQPELLHVHDWQAGLVPLFVREQAARDGWINPPHTCLTIHNLAYQGVFPASAYALTNLPPMYFNAEGVEFYTFMNCLKAGIEFSDVLTTVSPRYAREITTEQFGCGLDGVLRRRQAALVGILNGVDYEEWNTTANPHLPKPFSADDVSGKTEDKLALQKEVGLSIDPNIPLFATVTRLVDQKGVDIQLGALNEMLAANMQFVLLGSGSPAYEQAYNDLQRRFPSKVAVNIGFDQALSHRIEAGADFFLMPSRFEPCGLNQMYSQRYGTIPIVRRTGGLDDSVTDLTDNEERADGIKFSEYSSRALAKAVRKALVLFSDAELLAFYRRNAMLADFSWERTAEDYIRVYEEALFAPPLSDHAPGILPGQGVR